MKKTKTQKGITLVALIITIIVLLILAVVTINSIQNDGIISYAENAKTEYKEGQETEEARLLEYEYQLASAQNTYSGTYEDYVLEKKYGLEKWQKIEYTQASKDNAAYVPDNARGIGGISGNNFVEGASYTTDTDIEWRVLGVNSAGQLELISTKPTSTQVAIKGNVGILNLETKDGVEGTLDEFCRMLYGYGKGAAGARSLNSNDVNNLINTGYNPKVEREYTFKYDTSTSTVRATSDPSKNISEWENTFMSTFTTPYWTLSSESKDNEGNYIEEKLIGVESDYEIYRYITTMIENDTMLLSDFLLYQHNCIQLLATQRIDLDIGGGFADVRIGCDCLNDTSISVYQIEGTYGDGVSGIGKGYVRPVVVLKADAQLSDTDGNGILNVN